ncbi:dephospho-CoA kinase [Pseudothauera rhizosphaerae]|uniref:Dephospho-CoA kinase n=1 Tax=Pseudothauera rhizosphaerae TaxID=2565932 RepID=A0A4S4ANM7_9RHOO|nr:dephospho-CoA kinase [Pseudothauera rhizosphaerae]THF61257.1 dephospho-CoA kinase [Pseudothauera rhizosphaerae]
MSPAPFVVGLTGGIGSGKSAAADRFAALGAVVVDTDAIAHELTAAAGAAMPAIRAAFGDAVVAADGALDRAAMRRLAFADPRERTRLEGILHPLIRTESARQCMAAQGAYVVLVVPLLVESGNWRERCDRLCVVDCPEAVQIERVRARNGLSEAEVRAIMAAQAGRAERLACADDVIDNGGTPAGLHAQVDALHERYLALARRR